MRPDGTMQRCPSRSTPTTRSRRSPARRARRCAASSGSRARRRSRSRSRASFPTIERVCRRAERRVSCGLAAGRRSAAALAGDAGPLAGAADLHRPGRGRDSPGRARAAGEPGPGPLPGPGAAACRAGRVHAPRVPLRPDRPDAGRGGAGRDRGARTPPSSTRPSSSSPAGCPGRSSRCAITCSTWSPTSKRTSISPRSPTSIRSAGRPWPASWTDSAAELAALARRLDRARPAGRPSARRPGRAAQRGQEPAVQRPAGPGSGDRLAPGRDDPRLPVGPVRLRRADRRAGRYRRHRGGRRCRSPPRPRPCEPIRPTAPTSCSTAARPTRRMPPPRTRRATVRRLDVWTKGDQSAADRHGERRSLGRSSTSAATGLGLEALRSAIARAHPRPAKPRITCRPARARGAGAACAAPRRRCDRPRRSLVERRRRRAGRLRPAARPSTSWARSSAPWSPTTSSTGSSAGSASGNDGRVMRVAVQSAGAGMRVQSVGSTYDDSGDRSSGAAIGLVRYPATASALRSGYHDKPVPHRNRHDGRNESSGRPALGRADPALARELQDRRGSDAARR